VDQTDKEADQTEKLRDEAVKLRDQADKATASVGKTLAFVWEFIYNIRYRTEHSFRWPSDIKLERGSTVLDYKRG